MKSNLDQCRMTINECEDMLRVALYVKCQKDAGSPLDAKRKTQNAALPSFIPL